MPKRKRGRSTRRYSYPRRKWRRFRRGKAPMPILPIVGGVVAPMLSAFADADVVGKIQAGTPMEAGKSLINEISVRYCGYQPFTGYGTSVGWDFSKMIPTYGGLIAGIVGHMIASKAGVNRYMKRIPILGKWIAL